MTALSHICRSTTSWSFTIFDFRSAVPAIRHGRGASISAPGTPLAPFNRAPDIFSFSIVPRNQASGRGSSCSVSSLKFALPRREQAATLSHSPRQDVWLQTERLLRLQTFVPHSQDSRLPSPENACGKRMQKRCPFLRLTEYNTRLLNQTKERTAR